MDTNPHGDPAATPQPDPVITAPSQRRARAIQLDSPPPPETPGALGQEVAGQLAQTQEEDAPAPAAPSAHVPWGQKRMYQIDSNPVRLHYTPEKRAYPRDLPHAPGWASRDQHQSDIDARVNLIALAGDSRAAVEERVIAEALATGLYERVAPPEPPTPPATEEDPNAANRG